MRLKIISAASVTLLLAISEPQSVAAQNPAAAVPLTSEAYTESGKTNGVVLFAVRWDRKWKCAGFENAQLRLIAFDKLPSNHPVEDENADLLVADAPLIMTKPRFDDYAFFVEPGEYALSGLHIKAAASVSDVRLARVGRERLLKDGRPEGGSFTVAPGEIVYIGHFYLDCYVEPTLWRYYLEDRDTYNAYLAEVKKKYPELDFSKAQFRLFKTKYFGRDYELK